MITGQQMSEVAERTVPVQVAVNAAVTAAVAKADVDLVNLGWIVLLGIQIVWWGWKLVDKFQARRRGLTHDIE